MPTSSLRTLVGLATLLLSAPVLAEPPMVVPDFEQPQPKLSDYTQRKRHRWIWENLTAVRVNPLGLTNQARTGYRLQLTDLKGELFEQSFAALKLATEVTPAYARVGGRVELQPIAMLNLSAQYDTVGAFGSFDAIQSYPSPHVDYAESTLRDSRDQNYAASGELLTFGALVQAKVEQIAVRNDLKGYWQRMDLRDGDHVFYSTPLDILQPNGGWALTNDADLLYLFDSGLKIGARHTFTTAFYDQVQTPLSASAPDGAEVADVEVEGVPTHRVGPVVAYTFFEERDQAGARWNAPTLVLLTQWWAKHRFRTGADTSAAFPYLLLAFSQRGDFAP